MEVDLRVEKDINISRTMEMATKEAQQLHTTGRVHKVNSEKSNVQVSCFRCGKTGHFAAACWSKDKDCHNCGKKGHLGRACRNKQCLDTSPTKEGDVPKVKQNSDSSEEELPTTVNIIWIMKIVESSDSYWVKVKLEGHSVRMQIDMGSKASLVPSNIYKQCVRHMLLHPFDTVFKADMKCI